MKKRSVQDGALHEYRNDRKRRYFGENERTGGASYHLFRGAVFQQAEKQINQNEHIQSLIQAMKKKQKEIVAFEKFDNEIMVKKIEKEIEDLQDELDNIPIVSEFQQSQADINYLLQLVMGVIRDTIADKITVESGSAQPPSSCSE